MFGKSLKTLAFAAAAALVALATPIPAQAATRPTVFWVSDLGDGLGVFSTPLDADGTQAPTQLTPDTEVGHTWRTIATDDSHIYFADNNQGSTWDLVRTDFTGNNREVITSGIAAPSKIQVMGTTVFYSTWTGGLFSVPNGVGGTPHLVIGPGQDAGLGGSVPTTGYGPFVVQGTSIAMDVNAQGLITADISMPFTASNAVLHTNSDYVALNVTSLIANPNSSMYYVSGSGQTGYLWTQDLTTPVSGWNSSTNTNSEANSGNVYQMTINNGSNIIYTNYYGKIYINAMFTSAVLNNPVTGHDYGIAYSETPIVENTNGPLANTGSDLTLLWVALGLLVVGGSLTFRRKN